MSCVSPFVYHVVLFMLLAKNNLVGACGSPVTQKCYFARYPDNDIHDTITVSSASECEALLDSDPSYEAATYVKATGSCVISQSSDTLTYTSQEQVTYRKTCNTGCRKFALNQSYLTRVSVGATQSLSVSEAGECVVHCADLTNCAMANTVFGSSSCNLFTTCGTGCSTSFSLFYTTYRLYCYSTPDCGLDTAVVANGNLRYIDGLTSQDAQVDYRCDTGYVEANSNTHTCLSSGSWTTETFTCNPIDCGIPDDPSNGMAVYSATTYGELATFQCDLGYEISSSTTLNCHSNGQWRGNYPTCNSKDCGLPTAPSDGTVSAPLTTFGEQATYSCNTGFNINGVSVRTCESDGNWNGAAPTCLIVDCGTLTAILYGTISVPVTTYNSQATYMCNEGYAMSGTSTRTCELSGSWGGSPPTCTVIDCGIPPSPANGSVTAPLTTFNSQATYSCETGFNIVGPSVRTCNSSGVWNDSAPMCELIDCGLLTAPSDGTMSAPLTTFGEQATYSCNTGFNINGVSVRTCESDGNWNGAAPTCLIVDCGPLTAILYGTISVPVTTYNSQATYMCNEGYAMSGTSTRTCELSGSWDGSSPTCTVIDCGIPPSPANGSVMAPLTTFYSQATYSCETGFDIVGPSVRTCDSSGVWNDSAPTCEIKDCGFLASLTHGTISAPVTTYSSNATYVCNAGYDISGIPTRTCESSGSWSGSSPTCTIKDCGSPSPPANGNVSFGLTTYNSTVVYTCLLGYSLSGPEIRTCSNSGSWSDSSPTCSRIKCSNLTAPDSGNINFTSIFYNSTATYTCHIGYELTGVNTRTCNLSGLWDNEEPSCNIVDCGSISNQPFGTVSTDNGTTFGEVAAYNCLDGYNLDGDDRRTCLSDRTWNGSEPVCEAKDCGPLTSPTNGNVSTPNGTTYSNIANYSCVIGYTINSLSWRHCQSNGTWSGTEPSCLETDCGAPSDPANGKVETVGGTLYNSVALYTCTTSYSLHGVPARICQSDGLWSDSQPTCILPAAEDENVYIAPCLCYKNKTFTNWSDEEIIAYLIAQTSIDVKNTSSSRDRLQSRRDTRASSAAIGVLAASFLALIAGLMLVVDSVRVFTHFTQSSRKEISWSVKVPLFA